jgi:ERCC4-type nuclease
MSVNLSGVIITHSRDMFQTAYNLHEMYHYFQKKWDSHTSMREIHQLNLPTLQRRPSLVRKWAAALDDVGVKLSEQAERIFRSPLDLAQADESEWLRVPGVGVKTAQNIVREIWKKR